MTKEQAQQILLTFVESIPLKQSDYKALVQAVLVLAKKEE